jgi:hypothetical protein
MIAGESTRKPVNSQRAPERLSVAVVAAVERALSHGQKLKANDRLGRYRLYTSLGSLPGSMERRFRLRDVPV